MKKFLLWAAASGIFLISAAWQVKSYPDAGFFQNLRTAYTKPISEWPKPFIDEGIEWKELGVVPASPVTGVDSLQPLAKLGEMLFFDPRLSGSNQISCSSCHDPELNWSDGRSTSLGHDHLRGNRNAPTLLNAWALEKLFWDGRASSLEDQAQSPISNEVEMHQNFDELPAELNAIKGYQEEFVKTFGRPYIQKQEIQQALATFQKTITSRKSRFDLFLEGRTNALNDQELWGLHLFRTKARCMNCHNGPLFTDNQFHNLGLTYYGRKYQDLGRYNITKKPEDVGKFKTPTLRDVMRTRPWMHNGLFDNMEGVLNMYTAGMPQPKPKPGQENDPLFPKTSPIIQKLDLNRDEKQAVIAFLESISTVSYRVRRPDLPK